MLPRQVSNGKPQSYIVRCQIKAVSPVARANAPTTMVPQLHANAMLRNSVVGSYVRAEFLQCNLAARAI